MFASLCKITRDKFKHLPDDELKTIKQKELENTTVCFKLQDEQNTFYAAIDLHKDSIHLRHLGGGFAWKWEHVDKLCELIANEMDIKYITVIADKKFMVYAVERLGYNKDHGDLYKRKVK